MTKHFEEDNYLPTEAYEAHAPESDGFARFETEGEFYFAFFRDNQLFLRSEGYSIEPDRHKGIESVRTNMWDDEHFTVTELPTGKWVLNLYAANRKEIARSREYDSEKEARAHLPSALQKTDHHTDDYLKCHDYEGHPPDPGHPDVARFEANGEFLFVVYHDSNQVLLRSERYPTDKARDKGLESVLANRGDDDHYSIEEKAGRYFLLLKSGNHQEIARSCPFESEKQAGYWLPSAIKLREAKTEANTRHSNDDVYLATEEYLGHPRSENYPEFSIFEHEGEYYFTLLNDSDEVFLRSEGYRTTEARDKGIESVRKNRSDRKHYVSEELHGKYFVMLKASNGREIARSKPLTESEANALIESIQSPEVHQEATAMLDERAKAADDKSSNWWRYLIILFFVIALFFWIRSCNEGKKPPTTSEPTAAVVVSEEGLLNIMSKTNPAT